MTYDNSNSGALFLNDKKGNEKAPDRRGTLNVDGIEYELAGWLRTSKKGTQFLSLKVKAKEARQEPVKEIREDLNDEIPF